MDLISLADPIFYPIAGLLVIVFVLLVVGLGPQAEEAIGQRANVETSSFEMQSMTSALLYGSSYTNENGTPIPDSRAISYMICGRNPSSSWLEILNDQEYIETGTPQIPTYYKYEVNFPKDPADCSSKTNYWKAPREGATGVDSGGLKDRFSTPLPVRGGGIARIEVVYGVG